MLAPAGEPSELCTVKVVRHSCAVKRDEALSKGSSAAELAANGLLPVHF